MTNTWGFGLPSTGLPLVVSSALPGPRPSHREDARRIVRHGLADVLAWLGEEVGPKPGERAHAIRTADGHVLVSAELAAKLMREARRIEVAS